MAGSMGTWPLQNSWRPFFSLLLLIAPAMAAHTTSDARGLGAWMLLYAIPALLPPPTATPAAFVSQVISHCLLTGG